MRIAIVGAGISGLTAAWLLRSAHDITVFEAAAAIGGHTATVDVCVAQREYAIDTGFIVYNERTYPGFVRLLAKLGVVSQPTEMSFSLSHDRDGIEYAGTNLNTLFAERRNLLRPAFWRMQQDILRFNRESQRDLDEGRIDATITLGDYLERGRYSAAFRDWYLLPMGAAIWSSGTRDMGRFPLAFFVRFLRHHGLLEINGRPQWRTIVGGSRTYLAPLTRLFTDRIRSGDPVTQVRRREDGVTVATRAGAAREFDHVVLACHSDQALALLDSPSASERAVLGAIPYRDNEVVLHTDERLLPRTRRAWASWNYRVRAGEGALPVLTYDMNMLQRLQAPVTFCVTLNDAPAIDPARILGRFRYAHPAFTVEGVRAQKRWDEINGSQRTSYCGAYWANGFHEDGVESARRVAQALGVRW